MIAAIHKVPHNPAASRPATVERATILATASEQQFRDISSELPRENRLCRVWFSASLSSHAWLIVDSVVLASFCS
jgi:hypothetical protein